MQTKSSLYQETTSLANQNAKQLALRIIIALLVLLWSYTAASKLINLAQFKQELHNQTFSKSFTTQLLWFIPLSELLAATLLIIKRTRLLGFIVSSILMILFTGYIALVLFNYYERTPCSCGGVLKALGWQAHLYFNLFFLLLSLLGVYLQQQISKPTIDQTKLYEPQH